MSWEARSAADTISIEHGLKPVQRLILDRLADRAGKLGEAIFPSLATIKHDTGASESTIYRAIQHFLKVGILEYGDESLVAHYPADKRPRVYNMVLDAATRARLVLRKVGRMPWQKKKPMPKVVDNPVDKSPAEARRGVTVTESTPAAGCHSDRQTVNPLKINHAGPPADAVPASQEVVDHAAGMALRAALQARRAQRARGIPVTEPLPLVYPAALPALGVVQRPAASS